MKCVISFLALVLFASSAIAQLITQPGRTRKISYDKHSAITPIPDVRVKVETEERSNERGEVELKITPSEELTFLFREVYKSGYILISPNETEIQTKKFALNAHAAIDIILADPRELQPDIIRIKRNAMTRYIERLSQIELDIAMEQDPIHKEKLQREQKALNSNWENIQKLIDKRTQELVKIDYRSLSDSEIKKLELAKAGKIDELIELILSELPADYKSKAKLLAAQIEEKEEQLQEQVEQLAKDKAEQLSLARSLKDLADAYEQKFDHTQAAEHLQLRMSLDPDNLDYSDDYASYIREYLAAYDESLAIYEKNLTSTIQLQGEDSHDAKSILRPMTRALLFMKKIWRARFNSKARIVAMQLDTTRL